MISRLGRDERYLKNSENRLQSNKHVLQARYKISYFIFE